MNQKEIHVLSPDFPPSLPLLKEAVGERMYPIPVSHTIATSPVLHHLSGKMCGCFVFVFFLISKSSAEKEIKLFQFGLVGSHLMWTQAS